MKKRYYYKHRYFHKNKKKNDNISIENEILENRNNISYENIEVIDTNVNKKSFSKRFKDLKIKYKKDPKKFIVIVTSFLLTLCLLVGGSFATLSYLSKTENTTKIESGTLALEIKNESNSILLEKAIPQEDNDAIENNNEYLFTVENTGTIPSNYEITLDNTCELNKTYEINNEEVTPDKCIPNEYIKVGLKEGNNEYQVLEYAQEKEKYILEIGTLNPSEIKDYKMKVWLDYDTPNDYNSQNIYNIIYSGKLGIEYKQVLEQYYGNTYTIVYDANGGEGTMESSTISYGTEQALLSNSFKRFGYAFKGWSMTEESTEIDYEPNEKVQNLTSKNNGIIMLYAVWEKILTYQVRYNSNGGTGTIENSWHEEGILKQLSKNTFVKEHYNFIGWSLEENGEVTYQDEEEVLDLTREDGSIVDLYAVWQLKNYKINVVVNNGTLNDDALKSIPYNTNTTFNITANTGYSGPTVSCTNNQTATIEGNTLTTGNISDNTTCTVTYRENPTVSVTVTNGVINGDSTKNPDYNTDASFSLTPNDSSSVGVVECTNNQVGTVENNILTVSNVTSDTICTVKYLTSRTVLYTDGTFIINEVPTDIKSNTALHGEATNEYEAFSETNSYVFSTESSILWKNEKNNIINVEIGQTIYPSSTKNWFAKCNYIKYGDFTNLNTSNVTDMSIMFSNAGIKQSEFELLGLNTWNTSNVTDMSYMFSGTTLSITTNWTIGTLSTWNVSNVTNMRSMFGYAGYSATTFEIDLTNWDTSSVINMSDMFSHAGYKAETWTIGDLSSWNISSVTNLSSMFWQSAAYATEWNIGDLSAWDTSQVTTMSSMFHIAAPAAEEWIIGDISSWNTSKVTNMYGMFTGTVAPIWNIGNLSSWDTAQVTDMSYMFSSAGSESAFELNLSAWNTSQVINMSSMFEYSSEKASTWSIGNISSWDVSKVTDMSRMFFGAGKKATEFRLDLTNWQLTEVEDMSNMFQSAGYESQTFSLIGLNTWKTSNVTNMQQMFAYAGANAETWTIGDLSSWTTSNVTNMLGMFEHTGKIISTWAIGDLSSWDVSKVTNMSSMFDGAGCASTTWTIGNLSNWNVSNVTNMSNMFEDTGNEATEWNIGDLSSWDTSQVTTMSYMFENVGDNTTTFNSIGTLNIPAGCDLYYFAYGVRVFKGNLKINGNLSRYNSALTSAATQENSNINLYYTNAEAEAIVDELISLYGPNGTVSQGNIYKIESAS